MATNIAEFISILRKIRDEFYPDITATYNDAMVLKKAIDEGRLELNNDLAEFALEYQNFITLNNQVIINANNAKESKNAAALSASNAEASAQLATLKSNEIKTISAQANTLVAGSSASASYNSNDGKLTFGIPAGERGPKGDSFAVNAVGVSANRSLYDTQNTGFSFLDISQSLIYFKLSSTSGNWSTGSPFGKGDKGDIGATGVGITNINFVSTTHASGSAGQSGGNDRYRITLSNSNTYDITLHNGVDSTLSSNVALANGTASAGTSTAASRSDHVHPSQVNITGNAATATTLAGLTATVAELNYVNGVTSSIQTQLNGKLGSTAKATDSNLLGGLNSSSFMRTDTANNFMLGGFGVAATGGVLDWNHVSQARSGNGATLLLGTAPNGPGGDYYYPFSFEYTTYNGMGNLTQFAIPYTSDNLYIRNRYAGVWSSWKAIAYTGSPALTGTPTAPTAAAGTNTTQLATTAFVLANSNNTTAATVGAANAGIAAGTIGSYAFLYKTDDIVSSIGSTTAGANLKYSTASGKPSGSAAGTWRCMGHSLSRSASGDNSTLWLRIA